MKPFVTLATPLVIPAIFGLVEGWRLPPAGAADKAASEAASARSMLAVE